eukprot:4504935-Alexandrium_andersonii.AAC.1
MPLYAGLAVEFAERLVGRSKYAPESALPLHPGEAQKLWQSRSVSELPWWEVDKLKKKGGEDYGCCRGCR